jgi:hypothetical protein
MSNESKKWARMQGVQSDSSNAGRFQPKASPVSLHMDASRRRNLHKEEAARDRMIFRWVIVLVGICCFAALLLFIIDRMSRP